MSDINEWQFVQVRSSNIDRVGYDSSREAMQVAFKSGAIYEYSNVTQAEYFGLLEAGSPGGYLADNIKGVKPYKRVL